MVQRATKKSTAYGEGEAPLEVTVILDGEQSTGTLERMAGTPTPFRFKNNKVVTVACKKPGGTSAKKR